MGKQSAATLAYWSRSIAPFSIYPDAYIEGVGLTDFKIYTELVVITDLVWQRRPVFASQALQQESSVYFDILAFLFTIIAELFLPSMWGCMIRLKMRLGMSSAWLRITVCSALFKPTPPFLAISLFHSESLSTLYITLSISSVGLAIYF